jgi:predicted Fe-Mo cluster-binding NifX family protein
VKGSAFENMPLVSHKEINQMRERCGETLQQMMHCRQCRADAVGSLDNDQSAKFSGCSGCEAKSKRPAALKEKAVKEPYAKPLLFAVSSHSGVLVDQHFGQASDLYIYAYIGGEVRFVERRSVGKYCDNSAGCDGKGGGKQAKFEQIYEAVKDCAGIVTMRIGDAPRQKLAGKGIAAWASFGRVEDAVQEAASEYDSKSMKGIISQ